jgi:alcohol dehydrogenase
MRSSAPELRPAATDVGCQREPPAVLFGYGVRERLPEIVGERRAHNVLLVTGRRSFEASGARESVAGLMKGLSMGRFAEFDTPPTVAQVSDGVRTMRENRYDLVLGIGGGSVMDVAKAVCALAPQSGVVEDYVISGLPLERPRAASLVLVPTTAGSGSEVTPFSTIYSSGKKHSLDNAFLTADWAVVDPFFTRSASARLTAVSGADALSQAIEAYWSVRSTEGSRAYAADALRIVASNLELAYKEGSAEAREAMSRGALLAGTAIAVTHTTLAHAISYPLTGRFRIAHGHACILALRACCKYNAGVTSSDVNDERGLEFVNGRLQELWALLGVENADSASDGLLDLTRVLRLETHLRSLSVTEADVETIVDDVLASDRARNNPRSVSSDDLCDIVRCLL